MANKVVTSKTELFDFIDTELRLGAKGFRPKLIESMIDRYYTKIHNLQVNAEYFTRVKIIACKALDINPRTVIGSTNKRKVVHLRDFLAFFFNVHCGLDLESTADVVSFGNHASVVNSVKKIFGYLSMRYEDEYKKRFLIFRDYLQNDKKISPLFDARLKDIEKEYLKINPSYK